MGRFTSNERGAELVEWAIVAIIMLLATVSIASLILDKGLPQFFDAIMEKLGLLRVG